MLSIGEFARRSQLSQKALRLYDELGLLVPARVEDNGYGYYGASQLERARLVGALRQLDLPLAEIRVLLSLDRRQAAERLAARWSEIESEHAARRELALRLVGRLEGAEEPMYDVETRTVPARTMLCLERRAVSQEEVVALGKEFLAIFRERPLAPAGGEPSTALLLYHGEVGGDGDGPVEWCRPVDEAEAASVGERYPELVLRTEAAHKEAFVRLGRAQPSGAQWRLIADSLQAWAGSHGREPSELGVRLTFVATPPVTEASAPDCDFAVPLR